MNFFLDSTVFHKDYFLEKHFNGHLMNIVKKYSEYDIYVSRVVLEEVRNRYRLNIDKYNEEVLKLNKHKTEFNKFKIEDHPSLDIGECIKKFDDHFLQLVKSGLIQIIEVDNDLLPELIKRSIHRIKPFSENKEEFRDAIIWLSYTKYVEENGLYNCIFITNNKTDFYEGEELHPDLKKDSNVFIVKPDVRTVLQLKDIQAHKNTIGFEIEIKKQLSHEENLKFFESETIRRELMDIFEITYDPDPFESPAIVDSTREKEYLHAKNQLINETEIISFNISSIKIEDVEAFNESATIYGEIRVTIELIEAPRIFLLQYFRTGAKKTIYEAVFSFMADWDDNTKTLSDFNALGISYKSV